MAMLDEIWKAVIGNVFNKSPGGIGGLQPPFTDKGPMPESYKPLPPAPEGYAPLPPVTEGLQPLAAPMPAQVPPVPRRAPRIEPGQSQVDNAVPLGVRMNNPLNLEFTGDKWQGLAPKNYPDQRFMQFTDPVFGIRAAIKSMRTEAGKAKYKGNFTLRDLIVDHSMTDRPKYIENVSKAMGIKPHEKVDVKDDKIVENLLKAMITQENGINPYDDKTIKKAIRLARKSA